LHDRCNFLRERLFRISYKENLRRAMPLPVNIDDLIKGNLFESDRMEFKKGWNPEAVLHTICAFANDINNTGGGYIIVGIEEEDNVAKLPPAGLNTNQLEPIQKNIHQICHYLQPQ